jgi:hypothetical protein
MNETIALCKFCLKKERRESVRKLRRTKDNTPKDCEHCNPRIALEYEYVDGGSK